MRKSILDFLKTLENQGIVVALSKGTLEVKSKNGRIPADVVAEIKSLKEDIVGHLKKIEELVPSFQDLVFEVPPNGIAAGCNYITPPMVPLVALAQPQLDAVMEAVPGGAANIQDIYPLSPLQEGIYYHHLTSSPTDGDPYILPAFLRFSSPAKRAAFMEMLKLVVKRHDVLRTCILTEGLKSPVQVVLREVALSTSSMALDALKAILPQKGAVPPAESTWMDVAKAPLMHLRTADDPGQEVYYLVVNYHHLIMDHVGAEKMIDEIAHLTAKPDIELPKPALYRDFIAYSLHQQSLNNGEGYFKPLLQGIEMPTYPFGLRDTFAHGSTQVSTHHAMLPAQMGSRLRLAADRLQVQPSVLFHAAFGMVVAECSNAHYALFGSLFLGRLQGVESSEASIGLFINTLPVLLNIQGDVLAYIAQVKDRLQALQPFEQTPIPAVHQWSSIPNDVPLFTALLNYRFSVPYSEAGVDMEIIEAEERSNYPFSLDVDDYGDGFRLNLSIASTDIEAKQVAAYMQEALSNLLVAVDSEVPLPVSQLSIIPHTEKKRLLEGFSSTTVNYPSDSTIIDLFEQQVDKNPNGVALVFEGDELSYQELDGRSNQLASYLVQKGAQPEGLVGICIDSGFEMMVAILGVLKSGGAYVPIDPESPKERTAHVLADAGIDIVLGSSNTSGAIAGQLNIDIVLLDKDWQSISKQPKARLEGVCSPQGLAYVIYTSGSTGVPKGVLIAHKSVSNLVCSRIDEFGLGHNDVILQFSNYTFDASVEQIFIALCSGSRLVLMPKHQLLDSHTFLKRIEEHKITHLDVAPSFLGTLPSPANKIASLKRIVFGGEPTPLALVLEWSRHYKVYNAYGPTEATITSTLGVYEKGGVFTNISIGKPIANTTAYVLTDKGQLLPQGAVGELCIGGAGLARGYLNREELTKEKFVAHPFKTGEHLYKTGDLAKWLPDGSLEYIGRKDGQVKVRGYRIELGEIESVLSGQPGIKHCCVLAKEGPNGDKRLVGYVVVDGELDKQAVQTALKSRLPAYMVPELWVVLGEFPLTSSGKIDKKRLPAPESASLSGQAYASPRNEAEEQLVSIWQELLGIERVGIDDNFFELGGHSLLVVRLLSQLQYLGYVVHVKDIFSNPTIASLSASLLLGAPAQQVPANGIMDGCVYITPSMVPLVTLGQEELETIMDNAQGGAANIEDIYPMSPLQEGIYFHYLMSDPAQGDPYVSPALLSFSSAKKRAQFIAALKFVIGRHDVLRTCVLSTGLAQPVQVVLRKAALSVEQVALNTDGEALSQLKQDIAPANLWMDVSKAPLLQAKQADDPQNGAYYFTINFHHLILDHVGLEKIFEEIRMYILGQEGQLLPPALYRDFIGHIVCNPATEESRGYFQALLGEVDAPTYPFGLSDTRGDGSTALVSSKAVLPTALSTAIRHMAGRMQMSPAVLFHAAFGLVVGQCSNKQYALFGSLFSGRLQGSEASASSLGLFINTLPVLLHTQGSVLEYINQAKERLQEMLHYEQAPLSNIHQWSGIANDVNMFSALLNYRHSTTDVPSDDQLANREDTELGLKVVGGEERSNYPFVLDVDDYGNDFQLLLKIADTAIDTQRVLNYMQQALSGLLAAAESGQSLPVAALSILPAVEQRQLQEVADKAGVDTPKDETIVSLFEAQADKTPNNTAIVFEGQGLAYKELDERANQLARYLQNKGVGAEDLVGICIDRSIEMAVGILGILKSGGAYVPVDPAYPKARIGHILEEANIKVVLSSTTVMAALEGREEPEVVLLDKDWEWIGKQSQERLACMPLPEGLAYVIYTSGSTGKPKGVMVEHRNVWHLIASQSEYFGVTEDDQILLFSKITFDASVEQMYLALLNGGTLHVLNEKSLLDLEQFKKLVIEAGITHLHAVPLFLKELSAIKGTQLKRVISGGDLFAPSVYNAWRQQGVAVFNEYGPTETTVTATQGRVESTTANNTIGTPIGHTQAYILDAHKKLQPVGVVGELCIGGPGVARGYLKRENLTKERFINHPFKEDGRLYRTGDLARWLPDGNIEFVGRKDDLVKVRGYRIELGEIERVLSSLEEVRHCCVLAKEGPDGSKALVGYVVVAGKFDKQSIQEALKNQLPEYMIPQRWVQLEKLPLANSGKIDRKKLPDPALADLSGKVYIAPRNETEAQLAMVWQDLLGVERVGAHDSFFELGGHSLLATRLISIVRKQMDVELLINDVFEFSTIHELAQYIIQNAPEKLGSTNKLIGKI